MRSRVLRHVCQVVLTDGRRQATKPHELIRGKLGRGVARFIILVQPPPHAKMWHQAVLMSWSWDELKLKCAAGSKMLDQATRTGLCNEKHSWSMTRFARRVPFFVWEFIIQRKPTIYFLVFRYMTTAKTSDWILRKFLDIWRDFYEKKGHQFELVGKTWKEWKDNYNMQTIIASGNYS